MTFLFVPPQPENFVGGSWGDLEIAPAVTYQNQVDLRRFQGISDDNTTHIDITSTQTIDASQNGQANRLDTGTLGTNTVYYIWAIADSTGVNPDAGLISLSDTSPTMPGTHNKKRLVGSITTDGSPAFRPIRKINDLVFHTEPPSILSASSGFSWTAISVVDYTSLYARKALLRSEASTQSDAKVDYHARPQYFASTTSQYRHLVQVVASNGAVSAATNETDSGWVDLERVASVINFDHMFTLTGTGSIAVYLVGFQEILPQ